MPNNAPFDQILGEQLSAVSFVQDYVELHFDGPVIRALANPIIIDAAGAVTFPDPGSRDRLCRLISETVRSVDLIDVLELRIHFADAHVVVPLDAARSRGPESMHFQDSVTGPVRVWNAE
jgi:hypothetical protein